MKCEHFQNFITNAKSINNKKALLYYKTKDLKDRNGLGHKKKKKIYLKNVALIFKVTNFIKKLFFIGH